MKVEVKKLDKIKRSMKVEVGEDTIVRDKDRIYRELARNFKVPGFRPGQAPVEVVEKHHRQAMEEEFIKKVLPSYYNQALEMNHIEVVSFPRFYDVEFKDNRLSFSVEFEVKPEIELKESAYKGIKIKAKMPVVEEIEVEKFITQLKSSVKKITQKDYEDGDLAHWAGYASLEDFKQAIRADIMVNKLEARRRDIENKVVEELLKRIDVNAPSAIVESQHNRLFQQEIYNLRMRGVPEEDIKKYEEDIKTKLRPIAERQVKIYYILEAIVNKEGLQAGKENIFDVVMGFILSNAEYR